MGVCNTYSWNGAEWGELKHATPCKARLITNLRALRPCMCAGVVCQGASTYASPPPPRPPPPPGTSPSQSLRLVGGSTPSSGRLEVYLNGQWGTVCDDNWADFVVSYNAQTVCRQLGLPWEGAYARTQAYYGGNYFLQTLMDDVACTSSDSTIQGCYRTQAMHNCNHGEDVGELTLTWHPPRLGLGVRGREEWHPVLPYLTWGGASPAPS